jgi:hypothetical protein
MLAQESPIVDEPAAIRTTDDMPMRRLGFARRQRI